MYFNGGLVKLPLQYIPLFDVDMIKYPCPNPDAGLAHEFHGLT